MKLYYYYILIIYFTGDPINRFGLSTSSSSWLSQICVPDHDGLLVRNQYTRTVPLLQWEFSHLQLLVTYRSGACNLFVTQIGMLRRQEDHPLLVWSADSLNQITSYWSGQTETRVSPTHSPPCWGLLWRLPLTYTLTCSSIKNSSIIILY